MGRRRSLMRVGCPTCGAAVGERCTSAATGKVVPQGHADRRAAAGLSRILHWKPGMRSRQKAALPPKLLFSCPFCGALPGAVCTTPSGQPYKPGHLPRRARCTTR